jgi:hypothetical protein
MLLSRITFNDLIKKNRFYGFNSEQLQICDIFAQEHLEADIHIGTMRFVPFTQRTKYFARSAIRFAF